MFRQPSTQGRCHNQDEPERTSHLCSLNRTIFLSNHAPRGCIAARQHVHPRVPRTDLVLLLPATPGGTGPCTLIEGVCCAELRVRQGGTGHTKRRGRARLVHAPDPSLGLRTASPQVGGTSSSQIISTG